MAEVEVEELHVGEDTQQLHSDPGEPLVSLTGEFLTQDTVPGMDPGELQLRVIAVERGQSVNEQIHSLDGNHRAHAHDGEGLGPRGRTSLPLRRDGHTQASSVDDLWVNVISVRQEPLPISRDGQNLVKSVCHLPDERVMTNWVMVFVDVSGMAP